MSEFNDVFKLNVIQAKPAEYKIPNRFLTSNGIIRALRIETKSTLRERRSSDKFNIRKDYEINDIKEWHSALVNKF